MNISKIKYHLLVIVAISAFHYTNAQQVYKISSYLERSFIHNPAAAGANGVGTVGAVLRTQWSGISGGPKTAVLFGDTYFSNKKVGLGAVLYSDKTGPTSRIGGEVNISYSIQLDGTDEKRLMFGLGGEFLQYKIDKNALASSLPNDPLLLSSDSKVKGDASAGIYYRSPTLNIGFSAKQLVQSKLDFIKTGTNTQGKLYRQFFGMGSYNWRVDEDNVVTPHGEVRFQAEAPVDFEAGALLTHRDMFSFGVGMHYKQTYTVMVGIKIAHQFSINYAYDNYKAPVSDFDNGNGGHEITLRYFFAATKN